MTGSISRWAGMLLMTVCMLAISPFSEGATPPILTVADGSGNSVTIDSTGVPTCVGVCTTSSSSASSGSVTWAGTVGAFTVNNLIGHTKPFLTPPQIGVAFLIQTGATGGTLTVKWTDNGFGGAGPSTMSAAISPAGSASATFTSYVDNTNAPFGTGITVGTLGPLNASNAFASSSGLPGPTAQPFSMTNVVVATLGANSGLSLANFNLLDTPPPPLTLACAASSGQVGVSYDSFLNADGGVPPYTFSIQGSLPPGLTLNSVTGEISGTPTAAGTFNFTAEVTDSSGNSSTNTVNDACTITISPPNNSPAISLTKTVSPLVADPFQLVTYSYTVTNSGNVTLNNITITDDNGTPGYPGDDFTVGTIASLAPGASQTFTMKLLPPVTECDLVNNTTMIVGLLIPQILPSGDLKVTYRQSTNIVDNAYGIYSVAPYDNWPKIHNFSDFTGSDEAEFQILDGKSNVVLDFQFDYISAATKVVFPSGTINYPSGYGTLGQTGGDGKIITGSSANILTGTTTITTNLNQSPAFYGYTTNSPNPLSDPNFANWDMVDGYTVVISKASWGANGFGSVNLVKVHNSPPKIGVNAVTPTPCMSMVTNTATGTATASGSTLTTTATATVQVGQPTPPLALACPFDSGKINTNYSSALVASGGVSPYTYSISSGKLPDGLKLAPTGAITGKPTKAGTFSFTGKVIDSASSAATSSCTIVISQ